MENQPICYCAEVVELGLMDVEKGAESWRRGGRGKPGQKAVFPLAKV